MARPSDYSAEIADKILIGLYEGRSLRDVCRSADMPAHSTVLLWVKDDRESFAEKYRLAREAGYHVMADELLEICDDGRNDWMERQEEGNVAYTLNGEHVQRSRLRADTRKWLLSKVLPKIYGDKVALTGADGGAVKIQAIELVAVAPKASSS